MCLAIPGRVLVIDEESPLRTARGVANEARMIAFVPEERMEDALRVMRTHAPARHAGRIGCVSDESPGRVTVRSAIGSRRILDFLSGRQAATHLLTIRSAGLPRRGG